MKRISGKSKVENPLYWDANATSKLRPEATSAIHACLDHTLPSNPSSVHAAGRSARARLRKAKLSIAKLIFKNHSYPHKLVFTSGGTEGCNMLLRGFAPGGEMKSHIILSGIEHPAMLDCAKNWIEEKPALRELSLLNPTSTGEFSTESLLALLSPETELVSIMCSNNETGIGSDVPRLATALRHSGYHGVIISDCSQACMKTEFSLDELFDAGVDAAVFSGHKMGALGGIGFIVLNSNATCRIFDPLLFGGAQQEGMRPGTEFMLGIESIGAVCALSPEKLSAELRSRRALTQLFIDHILLECPDIEVLSRVDASAPKHSLVNTVYLKLPIQRADDFVVAMDLAGVCCSAGSACASGKQGISHVPTAMGIPLEEAKRCVRLSFDWDITEEEIRKGIQVFLQTLSRTRIKKAA